MAGQRIRNRLITLLMLMSSVSAYGVSGDSLIWDGYLQKIASNLQGVSGPAMAIIGIIAAGASWFLFRNQGIGEKAVPLVIGLSLVLGAAQWVDIGNFSTATVGHVSENPSDDLADVGLQQ